MMPTMSASEQDRLKAFFDVAARWCQAAEARDERGEPVAFTDYTAVAWDLPGALCRLFGWSRAAELFPALARHVPRLHQGERAGGAGAIDALVALQNWNDDPTTTHAEITALIHVLPVSESPAPAR